MQDGTPDFSFSFLALLNRGAQLSCDQIGSRMKRPSNWSPVFHLLWCHYRYNGSHLALETVAYLSQRISLSITPLKIGSALNATILFINLPIPPKVSFIAEQNFLVKIGFGGCLVLGWITLTEYWPQGVKRSPNQTINLVINLHDLRTLFWSNLFIMKWQTKLSINQVTVKRKSSRSVKGVHNFYGF